MLVSRRQLRLFIEINLKRKKHKRNIFASSLHLAITNVRRWHFLLITLAITTSYIKMMAFTDDVCPHKQKNQVY